MDPNEALRMIREWAAEEHELRDDEDIAAAFRGLDEWICRGGFLPRDWEQGRTSARNEVPGA